MVLKTLSMGREVFKGNKNSVFVMKSEFYERE